MAQVLTDSIQLPEIGPDDYKNFEDSHHMQAFNAMYEIAKNLPPDTLIAQIIRTPVADGFAYYTVVEEDPLTVAHIAFLDSWHADPIWLRGLNADDVRAMIERERRMEELFGERQG